MQCCFTLVPNKLVLKEKLIKQSVKSSMKVLDSSLAGSSDFKRRHELVVLGTQKYRHLKSFDPYKLDPIPHDFWVDRGIPQKAMGAGWRFSRR